MLTHLPGAEDRTAAQLVRHRLANGLRVVVVPHWPSERAVLTVHHGVGFRSEAPGQEGLAHVLEHLLFRGSGRHAPGRFFSDLAGVAGEHGGTTHFDHTVYHQIVPVGALPAALDREADRVFDPLLDPTELREQLDGIAQEIRAAVHDPVLGDVPWPYLTGALFPDRASAHDGYGDPESVRAFTVDDVRAFHRAHYGPENTVVTIVGPLGVDEVVALVERSFGQHPPTVGVSHELPPVPGRTLGQRVRLRGSEPGLPFPVVAHVALAPDPALDPRGHLAHLVLAELVRTGGMPDLPVLDARLGIFGVLDARGADVLTVTARTELSEPTAAAAAITGLLGRAGAAADARRISGAAEAVATRWERQHSDLAERAGAVGRTELLFADPSLVDAVPGALRTLTAAEVHAAAEAVQEATSATVVLEPAPAGGPRRRDAALRRSHRAPGTTGSGARLPPPVRVPVSREQQATAAPSRVRWAELPGDLRTAVVHDPRATVTELRLRVPLGAGGWAAGTTEVADATAALLQHGLRQACREAGLTGEGTARSDGQSFDVDVWCGPDDVEAWTRALAATLPLTGELWRAASAGAGGRRARPPAPPFTALDAELRRRSVGPDGPSPLAQRPAGTTLVAVSARALSPHELGEQLARAWPVAAGSVSTRLPTGTFGVRTPDGSAGAGSTQDGPWLTFSGAEPAALEGGSGPSDPARYLATGLLTAPGISRLAALEAARGPAWWFAGGRDLLATVPRVMVRARVPRGRVDTAVEDVTAVVEDLAHRPPSPQEVESVRAFCLDQAMSLHDSPARLADAVRQAVASGHGPRWVFDLPTAVATVGLRAVTAAAASLFRPVTTALVIAT